MEGSWLGLPHLFMSFGNQTLLAGKSTISFDDFPSYEPPLSSGLCPLPHLVAEQYIQMGFKHLQYGGI